MDMEEPCNKANKVVEDVSKKKFNLLVPTVVDQYPGREAGKETFKLVDVEQIGS